MKTHETFRSYLKHELEVRLSRNVGYSLRAYARDLKMGHARLSELLSGKKGLSIAGATQVADRLGLNRFDREIFLDLVEVECSRNEKNRERAQVRLEERRKNSDDRRVLNADTFKLVSDWHHFAILALMDLPTYQENASWVADQLNIAKFQAEEALERLKRLELVVEKEGRSYPAKNTVFSPDGISNEAVRKAHLQILQKTIDALVLVPVEERDLYSYILPIASKDLPEMRKETRDFLNLLFEKYSKRSGLDRVVSLSNQIIPLTKLKG